MRSLKLCWLLLLLCFKSIAQYPGGVSGNLRGWFKGTTGVTLTGGVVSQWNDQSGNGFNATQGTNTRRPSQNATGINYNTTITFDGADNYLNVPDLMASTATGVSAFAVARQTGTGQDTWGCVILGQANGPAWTNGGYGLTALNAGNTSFGFWVRDYNGNFVSKATTLSAPTLMSGIWNGTTVNSVQYFQDAISQGTDAYTPGSVGDNGSTYIGSGFGTGTDYCFYGDIAEVVVYNTGLTTANADRVNSYLSVKYGITMSTDYVNTSGTTLFTTASPYNNDIIGIGREDNNLLVQKQSHNIDDSVRIYLSTLAASNAGNTGSFANNVSYIIAGANTGKLSGVKTEKPASIFSRVEREWKVSNTNFPASFNMDIKLTTSSALSSVSVADLRLLVDADGDFSNATVYAAGGGLSFSYSNPVITVTGISTVMIAPGTTSYITIASMASTTPLPINLAGFSANECENSICLDWQTYSEKNNNYFEIDRSGDAENWQMVTKVEGARYSSHLVSYTYTDMNPLPGTSYYKLQAINANDLTDYSKVVSVNFVYRNSEIKLYPNPADEYLIIEGLNFEENFLLLNSAGTTLENEQILSERSANSVTLITKTLANGVYYLKPKNPIAGNRGIKFVVTR